MIQLPNIGVGCAALSIRSPETGDDEVVNLLVRAHAAGVRYFDVAPLYGGGRGEVLLGRALASVGPGTIVSTKVGYAGAMPYGGRLPPAERRKDFSAHAIEKGVAESLRRLNRDCVDIAILHDPPDDLDVVVNEAVPTLERLVDDGLIRCIGVGTTNVALAHAVLDRLPVSVLLLAGRYTLIDRTGETVIERCRNAGVQVVVGGIFNSGLLAARRPADGTFDYAPAPPAAIARAEDALRVCEAAGVPLKAAALQYAGRNPSVTTVLLGPRTVRELDELLELSVLPIPNSVWNDLGQHIPSGGPS